jgi:hypothetical protein
MTELTYQQKRNLEIKTAYKPNRHVYSACGTPFEEWIRRNGGPKECPNCLKISHKRRKCLGCGVGIIPGCGVGFHCSACADWNRHHDQD